MSATRAQRFYARVDEDGPLPERRPDLGPCHLWRNNRSYGTFEGRTAHRVALELVGVEIPRGYHVDHLCRRPPCVRPSHLEPVTPGENFRRGDHGNAMTSRLGRGSWSQRIPRGNRWELEVRVLWKLFDGEWHRHELDARDGWRATYLRCIEHGYVTHGGDMLWQITEAGRARLDWLPWAGRLKSEPAP